MPRVMIGKASIAVYAFPACAQGPMTHYEFDLSDFRDPLGNKNLMSQCKHGSDDKVKVWIKTDPRYPTILNQCIILAKDSEKRGIKWLTLGFKDYHGIWKSGAVAELIGDELGELGFDVAVIHVGN